MADADSRRVFYAIAPETLLNDQDLSDGAKQTWLWLDLKAGTSRLAKASYAEIAAARNCTTKSAARHVHALVKAGFLMVRRAATGHGKAHYGVVNACRSVDTNVHPDETSMSTGVVVEATRMSALLESSKEFGVESVPMSREEDGNVDNSVCCFRCGGEPAEYKDHNGAPVCWRHVDF